MLAASSGPAALPSVAGVTSPEPAVALRGVHRTYGRGTAAVRALDGVDLDLAAGTFTAVMGRSGSGKSTLLQCAAGLDRPTAGTVRLAGTDLAGLSETALTKLRRTRVGFVFQAFNLVSALTVRENVLLPSRLAGARVDRRRLAEVVARVGLEGRLRHRPAQLSGGEQQRVAIARALSVRPEVIFCDEPTGALDSGTAARGARAAAGGGRPGRRHRRDGDPRPGRRLVRGPGGVPRRRAGRRRPAGRRGRRDRRAAGPARRARGRGRAVLRLALRMIAQRPAAMVATAVALWIAVVIVTACGVLLESGVRYHGTLARYAAAPVLVATTSVQVIEGSGEDREAEGTPLAGRGPLPAALPGRIAALPEVGTAVTDAAVPAQVLRSGDPVAVELHPWAAAALAPYRLVAGRAPAGPADVVVDGRLGAVGERIALPGLGYPYGHRDDRIHRGHPDRVHRRPARAGAGGRRAAAAG